MRFLGAGILVAVLASGCATSHFAADATPIIAIAPGLRERLALMDAYRLNDTREVHVEAARPEEDDEQDADALLRPQVREAPLPPAR